ncbi:MAG TPA: signal recognition particle-docking protein FtsY [Longimicrobiales bacterium]|nr:signal recognition particle-docking protein FtsY [Longimicrobiales bacterium]
MARLLKGLSGKATLWKRLTNWALTDVGVLIKGVDEASLEALEEILLAADFGAPATMRIIEHVEALIRVGTLRTRQDVLESVAAEIRAMVRGDDLDINLRVADVAPTVYLFAGVNGVGKTTTLGKLAHRLKQLGHRPLLAAADTFRAGAVDQLRVWADRAGADFVGASAGADPASVAFDAIEAAYSRNADFVLVDTAGRLHTQVDLMTELQKVGRVIAKKLPGAPHETLLVLDATVGQNAIAQARVFGQSIELSGLVLAKLDSTARGGVVVALTQEFGIPVKLVGTGEDLNDLEPFDADRFANEVLAE